MGSASGDANSLKHLSHHPVAAERGNPQPGGRDLELGLSVSTADGSNWLSASAAQGTAPSTVAVAITPGNLPGGGLVPGTFVGQLVFGSASGGVTIPVSVVVGDSVFSQVNPISFTMPVGGANPLPQTLTIASTGSGINFTATATAATGGNCLQISPQGMDCCATPKDITVSVTAPASLPAGTYSAPDRILAMTLPIYLRVQ